MKPRSALALLISVMLIGCASVAASNQETAMTTTPPVEGRPLWSTEDHFYLAATIWAEARGEGPTGMRTVAHVIRNRVEAKRPKLFGTGYKGVTTHDWQFSCWNRKDPNRAKLTREYLTTKLSGADARMWMKAQEIATAVLNGAPDLTQGADHYHTTAILPTWATAKDKKGLSLLVRTAQVGNHIFYKGR